MTHAHSVVILSINSASRSADGNATGLPDRFRLQATAKELPTSGFGWLLEELESPGRTTLATRLMEHDCIGTTTPPALPDEESSISDATHNPAES